MTLAHFPNICEIQLTVHPVLLKKPSLSVFCRDMAPLWFWVCKFHSDQIPLAVIGLSSFRDWENIPFCQWAVYKATFFSLALNIEILHYSGVALTTFCEQIGQGLGKINGFIHIHGIIRAAITTFQLPNCTFNWRVYNYVQKIENTDGLLTPANESITLHCWDN